MADRHDLHRRTSSSGQNSLNGSVQAWSTSISWQVTMSNSSVDQVVDEVPGQVQVAGPAAPCVGMPQPSSALR
jgi:hypothetical protein